MPESFLHEKILIDGLREGNSKIYDYLFHYYYSGLVIFSYRLVEDMDTAEDIVQDFFFRLWFNREELVIRQSLKSYFFSAVKNRSLDFLKRKKIGIRIEKELSYVRAGTGNEEQNFLVQAELEEQIKIAIEKLPEKCKKVFLMNRFEGMKPAEIAKYENISVRTVEGHIGKAIRILRTELEAYLPSILLLILTKGL
ncbi:RNA polymerase sigma-70 factor [Maribellus comscasis]|uniref:RNA polymerase sigma-70 factor n=1 Tax=Maribellus comscasis TaxID=2681766 RepID=A0A6I6JTG7_9BACT|nr:RNA polymerase sigma-70 factor [Maribellus comscasis]QGY46346.1 RNA polymerase sigma-70 factor [Maribellus comscasis]